MVPVNFSVSSQRQCYMGNSSNHEHKEEIEGDTYYMYLLYEEERKIFAKIYLL